MSAIGVQLLVDQRWIDVPSERIMPGWGDTGETGGGHWCGSTINRTLVHRVHDEMCSSAASVGVRSGQPRQISGTPYMERWRFRKNFIKVAMEAALLNLWASTGVTTPGPLPAEASHVGKRVNSTAAAWARHPASANAGVGRG